MKSKNALPFPSKFMLESIKSKKKHTYSLKVSDGSTKNKKPIPFLSKLVLENMKYKNPSKLGWEISKQEKHYLFPQSWYSNINNNKTLCCSLMLLLKSIKSQKKATLSLTVAIGKHEKQEKQLTVSLKFGIGQD